MKYMRLPAARGSKESASLWADESDEFNEPLLGKSQYETTDSGNHETKKDSLKRWARKFKRVIMTGEQPLRRKREVPRQPNVVVHFVRDAQAKEYDGPKPILSHTGYNQAYCLSKLFCNMDKVTHILTSPAARTLQTTHTVFKPAIARGVPVTTLEAVRFNGKTIGTLQIAPHQRTAYDAVYLDLAEETWELVQAHERCLVEASSDFQLASFAFALGLAKQQKLNVVKKKYSKAGLKDIHLVIITHGGALGLINGEGLLPRSGLGWRPWGKNQP